MERQAKHLAPHTVALDKALEYLTLVMKRQTEHLVPHTVALNKSPKPDIQTVQWTFDTCYGKAGSATGPLSYGSQLITCLDEAA